MTKEFTFDIETFPNDYFVTFSKTGEAGYYIYHQGVNELPPLNDYTILPDQNALHELVDGATLISFNGHNYDDYVLAAILADEDPQTVRQVSDKIITSKGRPYQMKLAKISNIDLDTHADDFRWSLKSLESQLGLNIEETAVSFDQTSALTNEQLAAEIHYNLNDVNATYTVYQMRKPGYFDANQALIKNFNLPETAYGWGQGALVRNVLAPRNEPAVEPWASFNLTYLGQNMLDVLPQEIATAYQTYIDTEKFPKDIPYQLGACEVDFSLGGLHGVDPTHNYHDVKRVDIQSMYPTLIINTNALGDEATKRYQDIYQERLELKAHDPKNPLNGALKLILNRTSGLMDAKFEQKVANPLGIRSIRIIGQAITFDLANQLDQAGYRLVNVNTDGIYFTGKGNGKADDIIAAWEKRYDFSTSQAVYDKLVQKDVNNYFTLSGNQIAVHGGDVGRYFGFNYERSSQLPRILDKGIVDHLLFDQPVEQIVHEHRQELNLYAFNTKVSKNYIGLVDETGQTYQKINRVFGVHDGHHYLQTDGHDKTAKVSSLPDSALIINQALDQVDPKNVDIDEAAYVKLINSRLKNWQDDQQTTLDLG